MISITRQYDLRTRASIAKKACAVAGVVCIVLAFLLAYANMHSNNPGGYTALMQGYNGCADRAFDQLLRYMGNVSESERLKCVEPSYPWYEYFNTVWYAIIALAITLALDVLGTSWKDRADKPLTA